MVIAKPLTRVDITGDIGYADLRLTVPNARKKTLAFNTPFVFMAGKTNEYSGEKTNQAADVSIKTIVVNNNTVRFNEFDVQIPRTGTLAAESASESDDMDVGTTIATHLRPGDMLHFPVENLNFRVLTVTSPVDGTITVERAVGSALRTPATVNPVGFTRASDATIPISAEFRVIAPTIVQNSLSRPVRNYNATTIREAATQIIRSDIKRSRTRMVQEQSTKALQEKKDERKKQEMFYLTDEIESMILFGDMITDDGGRVNLSSSSTSVTADAEGNVYTASDGIFAVIRKYAPGNIYAANSATLGGGTSAISRAKLNAIADLLDTVGGGHVLLTSRYVLNKINEVLTDPSLVQNNINFEGKASKTVGNATLGYSSIWGNLEFKHHPMFDSLTKYKKTILAIKPENLGLITLKDSALKWIDSSQENDRDGDAGYFLTEIGLVMAYATEAFIFNEWTI